MEKILNEEEQIQVETIEGIIEDISDMNPEYIIQFLEDQIKIIKNGI